MGDVCQIRMVAEQNGMSEDYLPQKLIGREHQIDMIMQCLAPARNKLRPLHLHLYGGPGTGKTATVRHVLKHLNETAGLESVVVNCWEKDSFFAILDDIISQLGILRAESHRSCVKLDRLGRHLNHRPFIIVLDEIDKLKRSERSATLYNLVSLDKVGIICITGEETSLELEDRVRSRLCPYYVHFLPYRRQELMAILAHRAQVALTTRVWSDSLLEEIADMAAGDARVAIRALKDMAELAEAGDSDTLSHDFLRQQWESTKLARQAALLDRLTTDHQILHDIVWKQGPILSGDLWQEYVHRCAEENRKPLAQRTFAEYTDRLVRMGLMTSERARVKGRVKLFRLSAACAAGKAAWERSLRP